MQEKKREKIVIIGGGLLGLSSAQILLERGFDVELLEAREAVGMETSFANGGLLTASFSEPVNGPGVLMHLAASLFKPNSAMNLKLKAIPSLFFWGLAFLHKCLPRYYEEATEANLRLAIYSIQKTAEWRNRLGLEYAAASTGCLRTFKTTAEMNAGVKAAKALSQKGLRYKLLPAADDVIEVEPALEGAREMIAGGIFYPDENSGNSHLFCKALEKTILEAGGTIQLGVQADHIVLEQGAVKAAATNKGLIEADKIIVTAGADSPSLMKGLSVSLPIRPLKGYSITFATKGLKDVPSIPVVDDTSHTLVNPLGDQLRVVGYANFEGHDRAISAKAIEGLFAALEAMYPKLASQLDAKNARPWAGLRPLSSDGKPFIGATKVPGLFVNTGHGQLGWTKAVGSAHLIADIIAGDDCEIDARPYRVHR